jgi:glucose/mannose-6-phosphate isomerase
MTFEEIFAVDTSNMYNLIRGFSAQVRDAVSIGKAANIKVKARGIDAIVLCGLGGSAIGGDLLRSYLAAELRVPFFINRHYTLPGFVGPRTLVIVSSYSGDTEEAIAAFKEAVKRRARVLCISSGGTLGKLAKAKRRQMIHVPGGLPPRAALGYSFFPLLQTFMKLKLVSDKSREISETIKLLTQKAEEYGNPDPQSNKAFELAQQLHGKLGVVYSSTDRFDAVNTRWRGQFAENGKSLAFGHVIPEMNHNELVGWKVLKDQMREMQVFILRDEDDHKRIQLRMEITKAILAEYTSHVTEVWSEGTSPLARMFSLVYLGDWVSYYLAILNKEDPMPVQVIDRLKSELRER